MAHLGLYTTQDLLHVYSVPRDLVLVLASSDLKVGRSWKPNISSCANLKLSLSVIIIQVNVDELRDDSITRLQIWKGLKVHQKNKKRGEPWAIKQRKNWALSTRVWKVMGLQSHKFIHMCLRSFLRKDHCSNPDKIVSVWVYKSKGLYKMWEYLKTFRKRDLCSMTQDKQNHMRNLTWCNAEIHTCEVKSSTMHLESTAIFLRD